LCYQQEFDLSIADQENVIEYLYSNNMSSWSNLFGSLKRHLMDIRECGHVALFHKLRQFLSLILASPFALILLLLGIRFSSGNTNNRIGHLVGEPLYMELQKRAGRRFYRHFVLLLSKNQVANTAVISAFPDHFHVVDKEFFINLLLVFNRHPFTRVNMGTGIAALNKAAQVYKYSHLTSASKPFLSIPGRDNPSVEKLLAEIGVASGGWYVCLHNRESGYSPTDDDIHDYRNSNISNYELAISYLSKLGGKVIRMGDPSMSKLESNSESFDYAHSDLRSPENDLILAGNCRFFLGNSSGILLLAAAQGIPCVGVNQAPLGVTKFWGPQDIAVPKVYRRSSNGEIIPFSEVFLSSIANHRSSTEIQKAGVQLQESTPDEILEACKEMVHKLDGLPYSFNNETIEKTFLSLFQEDNYSYHSKTRVSQYFLKKYELYI
jgi:putative glycosyltransferase (TIGR04372 family)